MSIMPQLEETTSRISFLLTDIDGVTPLLNLTTLLTTLTFTLYEKRTLAIINSRDEVDIINDHGFVVYNVVQVDAVTGLTYNVLGRLDPEDNVLVRADITAETHVGLFSWTWGTPERTGRGEVEIPVYNLKLVPTT